MATSLKKIFDHLAWADARVLEGLRRSPGSDAQALEVFAHVLGAEHVWLARLNERPPRVAVWPTLTLEDCAALAAENAEGFRQVLQSHGEDPVHLSREIAYTNSAGQRFRSRVDDMLLQVALHGCYHRGQVAMLVRKGGGEPMPTDYIALARGAPAAARTERR